MKIIARIRNDFPEKFGIPRQSGILKNLESRIEFEKEFCNPDYLRGIEGFSHLWLIWCFSENCDRKPSPTVRPPRLGGNVRVGVFATRSPFRPNPLGLSAVKLERVEKREGKPVLVVSGADLMDGTPIYDIKPYLPFADSIPEAESGFAGEHFEENLSVEIPEDLLLIVPEDKREDLITLLAQNPRPAYQKDPHREYGIRFAGLSIRFRIVKDTLTVISAAKE